MNSPFYIRFNGTPAAPNAKLKNKRRSKIIRIILFFIPRANPDFDKLIDDVSEWQLEIDPNDHLPKREIGLDTQGEVIFIMPLGRNCGYWTDNNIPLNYFQEHFKAIPLEHAEFEKNWNEFVIKNPQYIAH